MNFDTLTSTKYYSTGKREKELIRDGGTKQVIKYGFHARNWVDFFFFFRMAALENIFFSKLTYFLEFTY